MGHGCPPWSDSAAWQHDGTYMRFGVSAYCQVEEVCVV